VLAGGGARSQSWAKIVAGMFDLSVDPLEGSEGSAMGAAIVAGASIGWIDLREGANLSARFGPRFEPDPAAFGDLPRALPHFRHGYRALKGDFHALGAIASRARAASIST
jgi:xylulokinase